MEITNKIAARIEGTVLLTTLFSNGWRTYHLCYKLMTGDWMQAEGGSTLLSLGLSVGRIEDEALIKILNDALKEGAAALYEVPEINPENNTETDIKE